MTDADRLEWACGVLNREGHAGLTCWVPADNCVAAVTLAPSGGTDRVEALGCFEAIAVALALDERARRRLPEREQAEWAAGVLGRHNFAEYTEWRATVCDFTGAWRVSPAIEDADDLSVSLVYSLPLANDYIRREMLPDGPGGGA